MEINVVNPHMLSILDKTRDLFLENRELCEELADNLQGGPHEDPTPPPSEAQEQ